MGLGPNKEGKFDSLQTHNRNMRATTDEMKSTIKFQMKEVVCLAVTLSHVKMTDDALVYNIHLAINILVSLIKKNWQNIQALYIKSTMSKSQLYYGAPINLKCYQEKKESDLDFFSCPQLCFPRGLSGTR